MNNLISGILYSMTKISEEQGDNQLPQQVGPGQRIGRLAGFFSALPASLILGGMLKRKYGLGFFGEGAATVGSGLLAAPVTTTIGSLAGRGIDRIFQSANKLKEPSLLQKVNMDQ